MNEIESLIQWVLNLVTENLYPGVFLAALIETVFPPIPSEAVFPLAGYAILQNGMSVFHVAGVGIVGGSGATLGATVIYLIALKLGRPGVVKFAKYFRIKKKQIEKAEKWFTKYGDKTVLFGRLVPGLRELVSIPAGILNMKFPKFLLYTFIGSCAWSMALTAAGYYFGVSTFDFFN
ncbi:MAG: DedA family protein [Thaumarchaeota archaeon]|nr:DedA family protein [Nitrososphaerota archaeon]